MARKPNESAIAEKTREAMKADNSARSTRRGQDDSNDAVKVHEKLKAEAMKRRDPWISPWQEIYDYCMPMRESFLGNAPAESRTDLIYDNTAVDAMPKLAGRLTAGYLPEYGEIFSLEPGPEAPPHMKSPAGRMKLDTLAAWIHESWQNSNLAIEAGEGLIDFAIGTMNLCQEPGKYPGDVVFTSVDPSGIAILPGAGGGVKGWFTWRKMALEDVFLTYRRATKTPEIERVLKREPRKEVTIECGTWLTSDDEDEKCRFVVILPDYKHAVVDENWKGKGCCPWSTARWSKASRDVWGRGPVTLAMPTIKTLNLTTQMILENGELALGGMWTYTDDGVFNPENITLQPGTFIPKSREGSVEELRSTARFDVGQLIIQDMQRTVKRSLYVDEMDSKGDTPLSSYEAQSRRADIARDLTVPGGRLTKECLIPQINRTIWIFEKQGILNSLGMRVDGKQIRVKVKSPLLRGQDAIEMNDIMTGAGQMNAILGQGTAAMVFKFDETIEAIAKRNGIDPKLLNKKAELQGQFQQAGAAAAESGMVAPNQMDGTALAALVADQAKQ